MWHELADTVSSHIYGPHLEHLARAWCAEHASAQTLGGRPSTVAPTEIACRAHGTNHQIDIVATERVANRKDRVLAIGEAKWRRAPCDLGHLRRLEHARDLLRLDGEVRLLVTSRSGFSRDLLADGERRADVELVDLERLYRGS